MSIFSEMAIEARNDSRAKAPPAQAPQLESQLAIPAKPRPAEQASALGPAPAGPRSNEAAEQRLADMSDQDAAMFSVQRVSADTERITRRNRHSGQESA